MSWLERRGGEMPTYKYIQFTSRLLLNLEEAPLGAGREAKFRCAYSDGFTCIHHPGAVVLHHTCLRYDALLFVSDQLLISM